MHWHIPIEQHQPLPGGWLARYFCTASGRVFASQGVEMRLIYTWIFYPVEDVRFLPFGRFLLLKRHEVYTIGRSRYISIYTYMWITVHHIYIYEYIYIHQLIHPRLSPNSRFWNLQNLKIISGLKRTRSSKTLQQVGNVGPKGQCKPSRCRLFKVDLTRET